MSEDQIRRILDAISGLSDSNARIEEQVKNLTERAIEDRQEVHDHRNEMINHIENHELRIRGNESKISKWSIPVAILIAIISGISVAALSSVNAEQIPDVQEVIEQAQAQGESDNE